MSHLAAATLALIWLAASFALLLSIVWLIWGRRFRRFEAQLKEQTSMYEFCLAESGRLRQEISQLRAGTRGSGDLNKRSEFFDSGGCDSGVERFHSSALGGAGNDLTRIKGIGPKTCRLLNALGILHYRQLAALTGEDIERLNNHFHFKGRIEREKWITQARSLVAAEGVEPDADGARPNDRSLSPV